MQAQVRFLVQTRYPLKEARTRNSYEGLQKTESAPVTCKLIFFIVCLRSLGAEHSLSKRKVAGSIPAEGSFGNMDVQAQVRFLVQTES